MLEYKNRVLQKLSGGQRLRIYIARVQNLPVDSLYVILIAMIGLVVVMLMRVVGLIMIIALLTVLPAIGAMYLKNMKQIMWLATG